MTRTPALVAAAIAAGLVAAGLAGCGGASPDLPEGLSVVVYQPRPDVATGRFAIQVVNASDADVDVVAAVLDSPDFESAVSWGGSSTVLAGRSLDLRVDLPAIDCAAESAPVVRLQAAAASPSELTEVPLEDPYGFLDRLHAEQCVGQAVAAIASVEPRDWVDRGDGTALLTLAVTPTGASGSVTLDAVSGTTLLLPVGTDGARNLVPLGIPLNAAGPRVVEIRFAPNRCDAHALAEDKVGTIIPIRVSTPDAADVRWLIPLPDDLRAAVYAFYARVCGLPAAGG